MIELNKTYFGDCLDLMKNIPNGSIDMILCDLPYGTTRCRWDSVIDLPKLWSELGIIGHVDHGKTTLTAAIMNVLDDTKKEAKTIHEIIEEEKSFKITAPPIIELTEWNFKSGKESRRERRVKERKANKKR